jgi:dethiobiotin synthetase
VAARGCFVTGTDTGAGKTILAAALCAAIRAAGEGVAAFKPVVTGVGTEGSLGGAEPAGPLAAGTERSLGAGTERSLGAGTEATSGEWPADHDLLAAVTGVHPADVTTRTFAPAVSPHLAAELAGEAISLDALVEAAARGAARADVLVVEGVGGLLVPLSDEHDIRDLAVALGLPLVIAARPGLGTINHSLLTIEAARAAGLDVRAVVLTPWPEEPTVMERSNRDTIARRGAVEVATLRAVRDIDDLASAGATLPWAGWLGGVSF